MEISALSNILSELFMSYNYILHDNCYIDFNECAAANLNTCHKYAHCENVPGTYICKCFEGFFGDGEECQGTDN